MMDAMIFYYTVPLYLTGVFIGSYALVRFLLSIFDLLNVFWDWCDDNRLRFSLWTYAEYAVLGAFIYYIVRWELSGTP
jgi:hypothetical protein